MLKQNMHSGAYPSRNNCEMNGNGSATPNSIAGSSTSSRTSTRPLGTTEAKFEHRTTTAVSEQLGTAVLANSPSSSTGAMTGSQNGKANG